MAMGVACARPTAPASETSRILPFVSACAIARSIETDGDTGALREASSITFTSWSGFLVHIFASSEARACSRCSMARLADSLSVGTADDGSDGGSSGAEGGAVSMVACRNAGGRSGIGTSGISAMYADAPAVNGITTAASQGSCLLIDGDCNGPQIV